MTIETNSNPLRSGAGKLPYLQIGNEKFVGYRQIKKLLDKEVSKRCSNRIYVHRINMLIKKKKALICDVFSILRVIP